MVLECERDGGPCSVAVLTCRLRLVSLAAQRFVAQVLEEASNVHQMRKMAPPAKLKEAGYDPKDKRDLLTVEDLVKAMEEVGRAAGGAALQAHHCERSKARQLCCVLLTQHVVPTRCSTALKLAACRTTSQPSRNDNRRCVSLPLPVPLVSVHSLSSSSAL